jgi:hypothetical protein
MRSHRVGWASALGSVVGLFFLALATEPAWAQRGFGMGWGMGWGMGFGGFNYVPSPTDFLNQRSLIHSARGIQGPRPNNVYANNPNSYFNRVRDNGFVPHYDVSRRRPPAARGSTPSAAVGSADRREAATVSTAAPAPKPEIPLASFFDETGRLVWPSDAPIAGDLVEKRKAADEAARAVLEEARRQGFASLTMVADARQKLLDYGRPALQEIRRRETARVSDTFHLFLLSLYESLEQAALRPEYAAGPPPKP